MVSKRKDPIGRNSNFWFALAFLLQKPLVRGDPTAAQGTLLLSGRSALKMIVQGIRRERRSNLLAWNNAFTFIWSVGATRKITKRRCADHHQNKTREIHPFDGRRQSLSLAR